MKSISNNSKLNQINIKDVKWTGGFWGKYFDHSRKHMLLSMEKALLDKSNGAYLGNFSVAAGEKSDRFYGTYWSDGDCYKWLEAVSYVYGVTGEDELRKKADYYIEKIARAQETDGYICTQIQLGDHRKRWSNIIHHELYNFGHLFTAAATHFNVTSQKNFLDVAIKAADYLYSVYALKPKELVHFGFNPSQIMGLTDLYRVTGDRKYLDLAEIFINMRGSAYGGSDKHQARVPFTEEDEAVGHSVTACYLWAGAADILREKEVPEFRKATERIWNNIVNKKMYITGAIAPMYEGISSRGDKVSESFGWEFQLPNRRAYNETCANIAFAMWNYRLLLLTGESRYGDILETALYNSSLSGGSYDGTSFYYANPLSRRNHSVFKSCEGDLGDNKAAFKNTSESERWKTHICYCCPPQYVRTVSQVHTWSYSQSNKNLWVNLYGSNSFDGEISGVGRVKLNQLSDYPWNGKIRFEVELGKSKWALNLRVPAWCDNASATINGESVDQKVESGSWLKIERMWKNSDLIELQLEMEPVLMRCNPLVEENHGMVCLMRGPVVYCLESSELNPKIKIDDIYINEKGNRNVYFDPDFFNGATLIETDCMVIPASGFKEPLYNRFSNENIAENIKCTFIPYHLWANRGATEMSVWFPLAPVNKEGYV